MGRRRAHGKSRVFAATSTQIRRAIRLKPRRKRERVRSGIRTSCRACGPGATVGLGVTAQPHCALLFNSRRRRRGCDYPGGLRRREILKSAAHPSLGAAGGGGLQGDGLEVLAHVVEHLGAIRFGAQSVVGTVGILAHGVDGH